MKPQPHDALAAKAKAALALVEKLTDEIEKAIPMTREGWREYGQALLDAKQAMPDTQKFGAWVRANSLDTGLAAGKSVRSNAMWVARHWAELQACNWLTQHHPTDIRRAYLAWQTAQEHRDRKLFGCGLPEDMLRAVMDLEHAALFQQHVVGEITRTSDVTPSQIAELVDTVQQAQEALERLVTEFADYEPKPLPFQRKTVPAH